MTSFKLPDLGEGLQEAEIIKWHVKEGQNVKVDQLILEVETAKAIVEIPSPVKTIITKLCANKGESVAVGRALFEYSDKRAEPSKNKVQGKAIQDKTVQEKSVSVVGVLPSSIDECCDNLYENFSYDTVSELNQNTAPTKKRRLNDVIVAPPSVMALAKKLGLQDHLLDHEFGTISQKTLIAIYKKNQSSVIEKQIKHEKNKVIKLAGAKKVMAHAMTNSHQHIPSVTLFDDADISLWNDTEDVTLRVIEAIIQATQSVPLLNAWFDEESLSVQLFQNVNLGIAVNSGEGLFVPVIRKIQLMPKGKIREEINDLINAVNQRTIKAQKFLGATISLSNFGSLSGRYATPIIVPPQVAIVGIGKIREEAVVRNGKLTVGRIMPISISFDHRAASGADASAFMKAMIEVLEA